MISWPHLLAFVPVASLLVAVPGPSVLFTIGRALTSGRRSALLTVLGNGLGIGVQVLAIALGLGVLIATAASALVVLRFIGGAYLVYLGIEALRHRSDPDAAEVPEARAASDLRQGFVVGLTNPKTVVFLVALLPQFVPATAFPPVQMLALGVVFVVIAILGDSIWALAAGSARGWFAGSPRRLATVRGAGGVLLIGLGAYCVLRG